MPGRTGYKTLYDSNRVCVILLMGTDSDAQYSAIATKEPNHLYILKNGKGYLGETPLFGGDAERFCIIDNTNLDASNYINFTPEGDKLYYILASNAKYSMTISGTPTNRLLDQGKIYYYDGTSGEFVDYDYVAFQTMMADYITNLAVHAATARNIAAGTATGGIDNNHTEDTIPTTQAVYDYINSRKILEAQFFRKVEQYTIQTSDVTNALDTSGANADGSYNWVFSDPPTNSTTYPVGNHGLRFLLDNDSYDGNNNEIYYYIDLTDFIKEVDKINTPSIHLDVTTGADAHKIKADLNIRTGENSLLIDDGTSAGSPGAGVYLDKTVSTVNTTTHAYTHGIHTIDATNTTSEDAIVAASPDKLVTERSLVIYMETFFKDYIDGLLDDFVAYDINTVAPSSGGGSGSGS